MALLFGLAIVEPIRSLSASNSISHEIVVSGIEGSDFAKVRSTFNDASLLRAAKSQKFRSTSNFRAHVKSDADLMRRVLRSNGYYAAKVTTRIASSDNRLRVELIVLPGSRYVFGHIEFEFQGSTPATDIIVEFEKHIDLTYGSPAIATDFIAAESRLSDSLSGLGFPFAQKVKHDLVVDHQTKQLNITFIVEPGTRRRMGRVFFKGSDAVKKSYLRRFIIWQEKEYFQQDFITNLRTSLLQTSLFSQVSIDLVSREKDYVDISITVAEAAPRTIGASAGYSTAEGVSTEVFWEHRNMFARGSLLKLTARGAEIEQSFSGQLELPHFARLNQTLSFESLFRRQNTDAFLSYEAELRANIDRVITSNFALQAGGVVEYSDVTDTEGDRDFLIASLPLGIRWDSSDDLLNPTQGLRASLITSPASNLTSNNFSFLKSEFRSSAYFSFHESKNIVLALRARVGSIVGVSSEALPATHRFFAGGGGSIRGFSFQRVGPLDAEDDPTGGRSVVEFAAEARLKVNRDIGIVPFIEGGNAYRDQLPQFSNFRWGVGIGARYHTNFGPIRFDLAMPLDRQPDEGRFQIYISLGQAF
ncbi:autotransporter assembly complex protein TamA [Kordiimonas aquimaris]|uniref:autotransporter assembly complex protein TamA n=1 Tax=Kordiimonas aquimaris TaxID=707591 RepID=UPI0021D302AE|nr:autotransporter assembly complex family protein [Kordiimonas aquimaris]